MRRNKLKRLTFQFYAYWKKAHHVGAAYVSSNTGIEFWVVKRPDPDRVGERRSWGHGYYIWTLYRGNRKLGEFRSLPDAQLAAQRDWEGMNWYWLSKEKQEEQLAKPEARRVFHPRVYTA
jgi:hypothetical protein